MELLTLGVFDSDCTVNGYVLPFLPHSPHTLKLRINEGAPNSMQLRECPFHFAAGSLSGNLAEIYFFIRTKTFSVFHLRISFHL